MITISDLKTSLLDRIVAEIIKFNVREFQAIEVP